MRAAIYARYSTDKQSGAEFADLGVHVVTHDLDTRHESAGVLGAMLLE